ncbi:unnamed protein product [Moneuplotes crassus]|uniref:Uncharacterized protein n=1 Tax=Euplotes crassus TaxID=5936 RepID=A0AAD1UEC4_EUPCR|nr:unnamed protein product [Moneuplotes crassus]
MNTNFITDNCENLSDEILSENASRCNVKISEKMSAKMNNSAFKTCKSRRTVRDNATDTVLLSKQQRSFKEMDTIQFKMSLNLQTTRKATEMRKSSILSNDSEISPKPKTGSLQNEIRNLLRKAAEIRRKSTFVASQVKPSEVQLDKLDLSDFSLESSSEGSSSKDDFFTFGVNN